MPRGWGYGRLAHDAEGCVWSKIDRFCSGHFHSLCTVSRTRQSCDCNGKSWVVSRESGSAKAGPGFSERIALVWWHRDIVAARIVCDSIRSAAASWSRESVYHSMWCAGIDVVGLRGRNGCREKARSAADP